MAKKPRTGFSKAIKAKVLRKAKPVTKKEKEFKRRSEASKKGWKARKLRKSIEDNRRRAKAIPARKKPRFSEAAKAKALGKKPKKLRERNKPLPGLKVSVDERIAELEAINKSLEQKLSIKDWVVDAEPEWIKQDGTLAMNPSRLRELHWAFRHIILDRMYAAELAGHAEEEAMKIAREENVTLREVWSIYMSP